MQKERELDARRKWLSWASSNDKCSHSIQTIPAQDHIVTTIWGPWENHNSIGSVIAGVECTFSRYNEVWEDAELRKIAIDILLSIGVNVILNNIQQLSVVVLAATQIALLDNFDDKGDFKSAMFKAAPIIRDVSGGGERAAIRFFAKRITCSCLKSKYSQVKKEKPKSGMCDGCLKSTRRETLMVCSNCRLVQFCSKSCQLDYWPKHKRMCNHVVRTHKKR